MLDPLRCLEPLPLIHRSFPLGYPIEIATNSQEVVDAAEENWGRFPQGSTPSEPMRVRIAVSEQDQSSLPPQPTFRAMGHLLSIIADPENFAVCDLERGFAFCRVASGTVRDAAWFRQRFLDGMVYSMLVCREVTPAHAACVMLNGRGVLLCGRSGAGKSSLALACALSGWTFITDDVTYLRNGEGPTIGIGKPGFIRFLVSAKDLFPELRDLPVLPGRDGEPMLELDTRTSPLVRTAFQAPIEAVVFLERAEGAEPALSTIEPSRALEKMLEEIPAFGDLVYSRNRNSLGILVSTTKLLEFRYWCLDSAVEMLSTLTRG